MTTNIASVISPDLLFATTHAMGIAQQVRQALHHIHQQGWVHADVKPANILRGAAGRYILCDFGLACAVGARPPAQGTPAYMSPEQHMGLALDGNCDWHALGVVVEEMRGDHETSQVYQTCDV